MVRCHFVILISMFVSKPHARALWFACGIVGWRRRRARQERVQGHRELKLAVLVPVLAIFVPRRPEHRIQVAGSVCR